MAEPARVLTPAPELPAAPTAQRLHHLELTTEQVDQILARDPAALDALVLTLQRQRRFDQLLPWPDPPLLAIYADGACVLETFDEVYKDQLLLALRAVK